MSGAARVDSTEVIKELRIFLVKFQESAGLALGDADSDINRISKWLDGEAMNHWSSTIRKRQEILAKAEDALRQKKLFKDSSGSTPSAVEEQKAVMVAKRNLQEAMEKLAKVKSWSKLLQKEVTVYRGGVSRFAGTVSGGVTGAIGFLGATMSALDKYLEMAPEGAGEPVEAGAGAGGGTREDGGPMTRTVDDAAKPSEDKPIDAKAIRASAPAEQALAIAEPAEKGPVKTQAGKLTDKQLAAVASLATGPALDDGNRIAVSQNILSASRVYLLRLNSAGISWYLGSVDGLDSGVYNTVTVGDLRAGRPDLAELLKLPAGSLAVVADRGLAGVFNANNESLLKPGAPAGGNETRSEEPAA